MNSNILKQYEEVLVKYDVSQNRSSAGIGYSAAAISQWRRGEYTGDEGALEDAVIQWLARVERSRARKRVPIVETDQMSRISQAIAMAHTNADIALVVDDAGGGKTTAAHWYAERNSRSAILIDVVKGMNSRALLNEMACQLGVESFRVNQTALMQSVADALEFSRRLAVRPWAERVGLDRATAPRLRDTEPHHRKVP